MTGQPSNPLPGRAGVVAELVRSAQLVWRLLRDPRVALPAKLAIPALAGFYLLWPADFLPDILPVLGQLDDVAILLLGARLFIQLCPAGVVQEHRDRLAGRPPPASGSPMDGETVDGEYRVIE